ncbi:class I SAM-dependent methyltransferase [Leptothermofonsia sp. ETS-13]|uniref:class I SAM-dependent methyltransferase n=1 Tax=Leptothermofonsia sp. ETS-13 TaxID=3035696 RepID=UPI003B9E2DE1
MKILNEEIDESLLTDIDRQELANLLSDLPDGFPELQDIWRLMDKVWDGFDCDNRQFDPDKMKCYYEHPVWLLNGLFTEQDEMSCQHRHAIAHWIAQRQSISSVLDYGGGFGTLARLIADARNEISIDVYEPYPSKLSFHRVRNYSQIQFISILDQSYSCIVCTDVLEHVFDPLVLLSNMAQAIDANGFLIIANCFYPCIKCHLPSTFHLRHTFSLFARVMGLKYCGFCQFEHIHIYQKISSQPPNWHGIRLLEYWSRILFPLLEITAKDRHRIQRGFRKLRRLFQ